MLARQLAKHGGAEIELRRKRREVNWKRRKQRECAPEIFSEVLHDRPVFLQFQGHYIRPDLLEQHDVVLKVLRDLQLERKLDTRGTNGLLV